MNGRAVIEFFVDEFLKSLNHLRRDVRIELNHDFPVVRGFDHGHLRIGRRLSAGLDVAAGGALRI